MNNIVPKLIVLNRYYRITRFYAFLKSILLKAGIIVGTFLLVLVAVDIFLLDTKAVFEHIVSNFKAIYVFIVFFLSEMLMGIVPPELFIAWGLEMINPWLYMFFLAGLSYFTGIFAYFLGMMLYRVPSVREYVNEKVPNHIRNLRKWGGVFIFAGAMLPLPHTLVSFSSGLIKFKFKHYLLWALFRFARFFIFALVILKIF